MAGNTRTWTVAIAAAALIGTPLAASAQIPPAEAPATAAEARDTEAGQRKLADEHLHKAGATLDAIALGQQPTETQTQISELQRRVRALRHAPGATEAIGRDGTPAAPDIDRKAELAAIEDLFVTLLGTDGAGTTSAAPDREAVGTTGAAPAPLDESTRTQLETARTHLTAYAAAIKSGNRNGEPQEANATASPAGPPGSQVPDAADATAATSPVDPTPTPTGTSPTDVPQTPAAPEPAAPGVAQADNEMARRHLLAARNTLSQLTQMPQATAITGEARTHISQLISRFNELIAANGQWREPFDGVKATLDNLLRPRDERTPIPEAAPGEPVGTTGAVTLDPEVREKLVEFRTHLRAFEESAGAPAVPVHRAEPVDPPTTTTAAPGEVATRVSETDPTAASGSTSTGSPVAEMPAAAAGTVGGEPMQAGAPIQNEALRHIEAIEALLVQQQPRGATDADRATTGAAAGPDAPATHTPALEPDQIDEIRTHLNELRRLVESRGR
jgi:hypothetical protein